MTLNYDNCAILIQKDSLFGCYLFEYWIERCTYETLWNVCKSLFETIGLFSIKYVSTIELRCPKSHHYMFIVHYNIWYIQFLLEKTLSHSFTNTKNTPIYVEITNKRHITRITDRSKLFYFLWMLIEFFNQRKVNCIVLTMSISNHQWNYIIRSMQHCTFNLNIRNTVQTQNLDLFLDHCFLFVISKISSISDESNVHEKRIGSLLLSNEADKLLLFYQRRWRLANNS